MDVIRFSLPFRLSFFDLFAQPQPDRSLDSAQREQVQDA